MFDLPLEKWIVIPNHNGIYYISNYGRLKSTYFKEPAILSSNHLKVPKENDEVINRRYIIRKLVHKDFSSDTEEWKDVIDFENFYKISSCGRVFSKRRSHIVKHSSKKFDEKEGWMLGFSRSGLKYYWEPMHIVIAKHFCPQYKNFLKVKLVDPYLYDVCEIKNYEIIDNNPFYHHETDFSAGELLVTFIHNIGLWCFEVDYSSLTSDIHDTSTNCFFCNRESCMDAIEIFKKNNLKLVSIKKKRHLYDISPNRVVCSPNFQQYK